MGIGLLVFDNKMCPVPLNYGSLVITLNKLMTLKTWAYLVFESNAAIDNEDFLLKECGFRERVSKQFQSEKQFLRLCLQLKIFSDQLFETLTG